MAVFGLDFSEGVDNVGLARTIPQDLHTLQPFPRHQLQDPRCHTKEDGDPARLMPLASNRVIQVKLGDQGPPTDTSPHLLSRGTS